MSTFRDSHTRVELRVRPIRDIRAPRDAHRYRRARECTQTVGHLLAVPVRRITRR